MGTLCLSVSNHWKSTQSFKTIVHVTHGHRDFAKCVFCCHTNWQTTNKTHNDEHIKLCFTCLYLSNKSIWKKINTMFEQHTNKYTKQFIPNLVLEIAHKNTFDSSRLHSPPPWEMQTKTYRKWALPACRSTLHVLVFHCMWTNCMKLMNWISSVDMSYKNLQQKLLASALVICFCFFRCSRKVTALYSFHLQKLLENVRRKKLKNEPSNNDINRAPPKEDSYSQATRHHNDLHKLL